MLRQIATRRRLGMVIMSVVAIVVLAACSAPGRPTAKVSPKPAADFTYLALGDSNVYGDPNDCGQCTTYPHLVQKALEVSTGKSIRLWDGSQHNQLTFSALDDEISANAWDGTKGSHLPSPQDAIAAADIITITLNDNDLPFSTDEDPCNGRYDAHCIEIVEKPFIESVTSVLSHIDQARAGKPTAIRVTTEQNFLISGPDYTPDRPLDALAQATKSARTFLDRWNSDLCAVAKKAGALCVDIYHAINGKNGMTPLPDGWYTPQYGDLNQAGHDFIAKQLELTGWAPLALG